MKIVNVSKNTILCDKVKIATKSSAKAKGLMFRRSMKEKEGFLMEFQKETKPKIWMLFMRFPIDIIFINKQKKVVDIKTNALPLTKNPKTWKLYQPKEKCKWVLEIKSNSAKKTKTEVGDQLAFK